MKELNTDPHCPRCCSMIADRRAGHDTSASLAAKTAGARLLSLAAHVNVHRPFLQQHPHFIHDPDATALAVAP